MNVHGIMVYGAIDDESRCRHYCTEKDRIAIKFYCCKKFYSCYKCHEEIGCDNQKVWPYRLLHKRAILCGACGVQITIDDYLLSGNQCSFCQAQFNPGCSRHTSLYFST